MSLAAETRSVCDSLCTIPGPLVLSLPWGGPCARTGSNWRLLGPSPDGARTAAPHAWGRALLWTHVPCLARAEQREPLCGRCLCRIQAGGLPCRSRGRRCACSYGRKGALPARAEGKNPPRKSAMGAACISLLSRRCHVLTQCAAKPSSILTISSRAAKYGHPYSSRHVRPPSAMWVRHLGDSSARRRRPTRCG